MRELILKLLTINKGWLNTESKDLYQTTVLTHFERTCDEIISIKSEGNHEINGIQKRDEILRELLCNHHECIGNDSITENYLKANNLSTIQIISQYATENVQHIMLLINDYTKSIAKNIDAYTRCSSF